MPVVRQLRRELADQDAAGRRQNRENFAWRVSAPLS
jgi:hypothetical protein